MSDTELEGPKYRLEHASNGRATCQQAACKRSGIKIAKGELRIGTHTLFDRDEEHRWYMAWRHWACATKHQINGIKELTNDDPTKAHGYERLSSESREQVKLTLESGCIPDKSFKDIRPDLAGAAHIPGRGDIFDAEGYKIDVPNRPAMCRAPQCTSKVVKGELRVGFLRPFDGDHSTWVYKHWNCITTHDINALKGCHDQDGDNGLDGFDAIPSAAMKAVLETLQTGKLINAPSVEVAVKKKTTKTAKKVLIEAAEPEQQGSEVVDVQVPRRSGRKRTAAYVEPSSETESDYAPKKKTMGKGKARK